jgi:hypothetical protein
VTNIGEAKLTTNTVPDTYLLLFIAAQEGDPFCRPSKITLDDIKSSVHDSFESAQAAAQAVFDDSVKATRDYDPAQPDELEWFERENGVWQMPDLYLCAHWWECQIRKVAR